MLRIRLVFRSRARFLLRRCLSFQQHPEEIDGHLIRQLGHKFSVFVSLIRIVSSVQQQQQKKWSDAENHLQSIWTEELVLVETASNNYKYDSNVGYQGRDDIQTPDKKQPAKLFFFFFFFFFLTSEALLWKRSRD